MSRLDLEVYSTRMANTIACLLCGLYSSLVWVGLFIGIYGELAYFGMENQVE